MMRTVLEDEIHGLDYSSYLSSEYFMEHIPDYRKPVCSKIHHVDTQLRESLKSEEWRFGKKYWRIQGYINYEDIIDIEPEFDGAITLANDKLEIWTMCIKFV